MAEDKLALLTEGFKLNTEQRGLIIRVGWVVFVTFHIGWVCGWLGVLGMASPFVAAHDLKESEQRMQMAIAQGTAPTNEGFKAILETDIRVLEEDVNVALARKASAPSKWTELDERRLTRDQQRLEAKRKALAALEAAKAQQVSTEGGSPRGR